MLNAGLLDQKFALEWIQKYIHLFGGDKDRVSIWGLSAGGGSVLHHVLAYNGSLGTSLFHAAIANSPFLPPIHSFNSEFPQSNYQLFISEAGCAGENDTFACLVNKDTPTLMKANAVVSGSGELGTYAFVPVKHLISH